MSGIYNAIANAGANAGQGIQNFFASKYQVDRDRMLDQEAQAQNAYVKQRDTMQIQQQALQEAARIAGAGDMEAAFGYLDQVGSQIGAPPADRERLAPILQGMARTYQQTAQPLQPPKTRTIRDGDQIRTEEWNPQTGQWAQIATAPRMQPSTTVINNTGQAATFRDALTESNVEEFGEIQRQASRSRALIPQIETARSIDVETGAQAELQLSARRVGAMLGIPVDESKIANAESYIAVVQRMVNDRVSQEKGPQTEGDVQRFKETMAGLGKGQDANRFLLGYAEAIAMRDIDRAEFFRRGVLEDKDYEEIRREWDSYSGNIPIISDTWRNPETGLPVFFYEFRSDIKRRNPSATEQEIVEAWLNADN